MKKIQLDPYRWKQLMFLSAASFFDGYDFIALAQLLPNIRSDFGIGEFQGGLMVTLINVGAIAAFFLLKATDRIGRLPMLNLTIAGYTACTFLSGFAPDVFSFALLQGLGRFFLIAEVSVAMIYAAEEFPAERRGLALGVVQGFLSLGMIVCAALTPVLLTTPWGWRSVYFVGVIPLILIAWSRRSLKESERFSMLGAGARNRSSNLTEIFRTPYRGRVLIMGMIWCLTYACTQSVVTFWKEFAVAERGYSDADVGFAIAVASAAALPLVFLAGRLIDKLGRKTGALLIFGTEAAAVLLSYSLHDRTLLILSLILGIFGISAVMIVLNAFNSELFPTKFRGNAYAWSNNLIGRLGYVVSPVIVGYVATGSGWGTAVRLTAIPLLAALILILMLLPETRARELEETSSLD